MTDTTLQAIAKFERAPRLDRIVFGGGSGQIGSLLARHFQGRGAKVCVLARTTYSAPWQVTAWDGERLIGLGNAISDGYLVVYYPHLLVLPEYQRRGIGREIMRRLMARYPDFHQHVIIADGRAVDFYRKCGFDRAGKSEPMWIYAGHEH